MDDTNNPEKPGSSGDLREAVARALWEINCDDQTYDEALSGARARNQHDARAIEFIHDLADAAIAVVVERCADIDGLWLRINSDGEPSGEYCSVDTGEANMHKYIRADRIRALAREE